MSPLVLLTLSGMVIAAGLVIGVRSLRPAPPDLGQALQQLAFTPSRPGADIDDDEAITRYRWLPTGLIDWVIANVGVRGQDLAITGKTRNEIAARKLAYAGIPLLISFTLAALAAMTKFPAVAPLLAIPGVAAAVVLWRLPSQELQEEAAEARREWTSNIGFFLTLVAGERRARGSVPQALREAAAISGTGPFLQIQRAVERGAMSADRKPWDDLRQLAEELDLPDLRDVAELSAIASDGAAVYNTITKTVDDLRQKQISAARADANAASERMSRPIALLTSTLLVFIIFAAILNFTH